MLLPLLEGATGEIHLVSVFIGDFHPAAEEIVVREIAPDPQRDLGHQRRGDEKNHQVISREEAHAGRSASGWQDWIVAAYSSQTTRKPANGASESHQVSG